MKVKAHTAQNQILGQTGSKGFYCHYMCIKLKSLKHIINNILNDYIRVINTDWYNRLFRVNIGS